MIGRTLNHYRIEKKLGSGGMGEVYLAEDGKLHRKVVLKILPPEVATTPARRERFELEARAVAALNHPHIVTIFSIEEAQGIHFLTMELVPGTVLAEIIPPGGLPLNRILEIGIPLADAVAAAHQQGITHRDLKPANVMLSREGRVKVLDFGLAKLHETPAEASGGGSRLPTVPLTQEGHIVGTVAYMSPEQAEGKLVDPRSDVFSLGIILHEMATGQRPFQGESSISILSSILKDTPPPVTQHNPRLPRDLARIVNRCLAKDPSQRFQSALGLKNELATLKIETESGETAVPATPESRPGGGAVPRRARTIGIGLAALAAAALAYVGWISLRDRGAPGMRTAAPASSTGAPAPAGPAPLEARRRIVVLPLENLGRAEDQYFADGVTEEITSRLASVRDLAVISRTSAAQYARTGKTVRQIGEELGVDFVLEGSVRWDRSGRGTSRIRVTPQLVRVADDTHVWSDRYDRDLEDIFDVQSEIAGKVVEQLGVALLAHEEKALAGRPTENLVAYQAYLKARGLRDNPAGSLEDLKKSIVAFEEAVRLDPDFALAWADLSRTHSGMFHEKVDATEERLALARTAADRALRLQPDLPAAHLALGYYYYWGRKDYDRALQELLPLAEGGREASEVLAAVAYIRRRQGRFEEALAGLEQAFRLDPRNVLLAMELGNTLRYLRRYSEADERLAQAIAIEPAAWFASFMRAWNALAWKGDTRQARAVLDPAPPIREPMTGFFWVSLDVMDGLYDRALERLETMPVPALAVADAYWPKELFSCWILHARGASGLARTSCEAARSHLEKKVDSDPRDPRYRSSLAYSLALLGRKDDAIREATLASDLLPVSRDAVDGPQYVQELAVVYSILGESEAALDRIEHLLSIPSGLSTGLLRVDPAWKPLRGNPRFEALLAKAPKS